MQINEDKIEQFESVHAGRFFIRLGDLKRGHTDKFIACLPSKTKPARQPEKVKLYKNPTAISPTTRGLEKIHRFVARALTYTPAPIFHKRRDESGKVLAVYTT